MPATAQRLKFGEFELDLRSGELWKNGARIVLPNQLFRILSVLIERRGNLVTRDELGREIWPEDTFVDFEHSLNAGIRRLRQTIGDSAAAPQFIETIPQRGYRFIAGVEESSTTLSNENAAAAPLQEDFPPAGTRTTAAGGLRNWPLVSVAALIVLVAITFVLLGSRRKSSRADATHRILIRLTSTPGLNADPALSPDGALLAYASDRGGADFDIYVQAVAGGDPVRLTNNPAQESEPSFAPDGARIVFSRRGAGLYVVGALGGEPRLIVRTPWARTPKFSPDGRWISYWTGFPASVVAGGIPGALGSIFIVPSEGGSPREIVTHLASARYPIWSPDGEHILFLGEENPDQKTHDWYVIPRDGGRAIKTGTVQALRAAGLDTPFPIPGAWRARDNAVVFTSNETDSSNIWQIPIGLATGRVSGVPERLTFGTAIERNPVIANSGRIAFASIVEKVGIWRVPLDTRTGIATGALERVIDDAANDRLRTVSSDGRTLFFLSSRTKPDELWIKNLQTGLERQVTHSGAEEASASPDGSRVAFSSKAAGKRNIEIINTADDLPSKFCDGCFGPAGWSRDGKRLLYSKGVPARLFVYDFACRRETELVTHPTWSLERPRFSPDGRWVTFHTANSPNVRQIYSVRVTGDGPVPRPSWVPVVTDHGCHPSWSSNGTRLYYFSFRDGAFCPWVQRVDPATNRPIGPPRAVSHFHHPRLRAASGAAAFNDVQAGYLYLTLTEATGNIWIIDNKAQ